MICHTDVRLDNTNINADDGLNKTNADANTGHMLLLLTTYIANTILNDINADTAAALRNINADTNTGLNNTNANIAAKLKNINADANTCLNNTNADTNTGRNNTNADADADAAGKRSPQLF